MNIQALQAYLEAINGHTTWSELEPLFDQAIHKDIVLVSAQGDLNFEQWKQAVRGLLRKGAKSSDFRYFSPDANTAFYRVTLTLRDGSVLRPVSKGWFEDGKLIRIEPVDSSVYEKISQEET